MGCMKIAISFIRKKFTLIMLCFFIQASVFAQLKTIRGTVKDTLDAPLPGVTVSVKGGKATALTDDNGNFSINITNNGKLLRLPL